MQNIHSLSRSLLNIKVDIKLFKNIDFVLIKKFKAIPIYEENDIIFVAYSKESLESEIFSHFESIFLKPIKIILFDEKEISLKFDELEASINLLKLQDKVLSGQDKLSIIELIKVLIEYASKLDSSDIHIELKKKEFFIKYRIDGVLHNIFKLNSSIFQALLTRIKLLASLDISSAQKPLNGRFTIKLDKRNIDCRLSIMPTISGDSIVLRLLENKNSILKLQALGYSEENLQKIYKALKHRYGMILVTGPTGSGKTTTLYGMLEYLNTSYRKIITIEDPVEYQIDSITQVQVNEKHGFRFSDALKNILRQDPDILMLGEIRDKESLDIAIKASLTGHLLLSTIHTNSAMSTIIRLKDMDIEEYLLKQTLLAIVSQRLIRKLCNKCKIAIHKSDMENSLSKYKKYLTNEYIYKANGCGYCSNTGYKGRESVSEIILLDMEQTNMEDISGYKTILDDAMDKVNRGITSIDEVLSVII